MTIAESVALDLANVLIQGDLSSLSPEQKTNYYLRVCESLKLNPYTKPFGFIKFRDGGEQLYALKNCTDQLRDINRVSITGLERSRDSDMVTVTAHGRLPDGRTDAAMGAVWIKGLGGEILANAIMKAETKAKRRLTLAICGLGWTDESEVGSIPGAEVIEGPALPEPAEAYVPIRERDVDDAPRQTVAPQPRMITSADDPLWARWLEVRSEALKHGVVPPNLQLPVAYQQMVSTANMVKAQTEDAQARLANEEQSRTVGRVQGVKLKVDREAERRGVAWQHNRNLSQHAAERGIRARTLPSDSSTEDIETANRELEDLLATALTDEEDSDA